MSFVITSSNYFDIASKTTKKDIQIAKRELTSCRKSQIRNALKNKDLVYIYKDIELAYASLMAKELGIQIEYKNVKEDWYEYGVCYDTTKEQAHGKEEMEIWSLILQTN